MPDILVSPGAATLARLESEQRLQRVVDIQMRAFLAGVERAALDALGVPVLLAAGRHRAPREPFRLSSVISLWEAFTDKIISATRRLLGRESESTLAEDYLAGALARIQGHELPDQTFQAIEAVLSAAVENGWSERVIHSELIEALDIDSALTYRTTDAAHPLDRKGFSFTDYALRLARTEATAAFNVRQLSAADSDKDMRGKRWVAYMDRRTRRTHRHANGLVVPISATFPVGFAQMQYPGDPTGGAAETANCRCTLVAVPRYDLP